MKMKKSIPIIIIIIISCCFALCAQDDIDNVLVQIEKNNTTLAALYHRSQAQKIGNQAGIYPSNPTLEFNFLSGSPREIGKRTDFSINQSFDFPTAYLYKKHIANDRNEQATFEFQKERQSILLEARLLCIDLVYVNAFQLELNKRLSNAQSIFDSFTAKFAQGDANILEVNKAQLNLLDAKKERENNEIERNTLLAELTRLNGGIPVELNVTTYKPPAIPDDFEHWFLLVEKQNPGLQSLKKEIEILQSQIKLEKTLNLPRFSVGYLSEKETNERFHGFTLGFSIPLWERKNAVKYAKATAMAIRSIEVDSKLQFYNQLKILYNKAIAQQKSTIEYRSQLAFLDNSLLLKKALEEGEISLIQYMLELSLYYDSMTRLLQSERDLNKTIAILNQNQH